MIKVVGMCAYAHKSNEVELMSYLFKKGNINTQILSFTDAVIKSDIDFDIIKYDRHTGALTVISSPDWDTANEPLVGMCYRWPMEVWSKWHDGEPIPAPITSVNNKQIYHNKWMFVADDYKGFDLEESKKRTETWNAIPGITELKSKIGYKSFWIDLLKENNIEI